MHMPASGRSVCFSLLSLILVCLPALSGPPYTKFQGYVQKGGAVVVTAAVSSVTKVQQSFPGATVTVRNSFDNSVATIYSNSTGTSLANPFTADTTGFWSFFASDGVSDSACGAASCGSYSVTFSGTGVSSPYTWSTLTSFDPRLLPLTISDQSYFQTGRTFYQACIAATAASRTLLVSAAWTALATGSCAANLQFYTGGSVQSAAGQTLTLTGDVDCPSTSQCFDVSLGSIVGSGKALGRPVTPFMFGAAGNGSTDDAAAIQAAVNFLGVGSAANQRSGKLVLAAPFAIGSTISLVGFAGKIECYGAGTPGESSPIGNYIKWKTGASSGIPMFQYDASIGFSVDGCKTLGNAANPPSAHWNCHSSTGTSQRVMFSNFSIEETSSTAGAATNGFLADGSNANCDSHLLMNGYISHTVTGINLTRTQNVAWVAENLICVNNTGSCGAIAGGLTVINGSAGANGNSIAKTGGDWLIKKDSSGANSNPLLQLISTVSDGSVRFITDNGVSGSNPSITVSGGAYNINDAGGAPDDGACGPTSNTSLYPSCTFPILLAASLNYDVDINGINLGTSGLTPKAVFNFGGAVAGNVRHVTMRKLNISCPSFNFSNFLVMTSITGSTLADINETYDFEVCGGYLRTQNGPFGSNAVVQPTPGEIQAGTIVLLNGGVSTFIPVLKFGAGTTGITYSQQVAEYTSIAGVINARVAMVLTSKGSATGSATVCGFPAAANNQNSRWGGEVGYMNGMSSVVTPVFSLNSAATCVDVYNAGTGNIGAMTDTNFSNTTNLQFTITYHQ